MANNAVVAPQIAIPAPTGAAAAAQAQQQVIPFRKATVERVSILPAENQALTAQTAFIERTVAGSGYIFGIMLQVTCTTAGNAAAVTFSEDGPYNVLGRVVFHDVNGELVNVDGWSLYLANLINRNYAVRFLDQSVLSSSTTGAVGTGGSFTFWAEVPVAINRRDLHGLVANQDRAQSYQLRTDLNASAVPYGVAPTTPGTVVVNKFYENYSVPMPVAPSGAPQQVFPDTFGLLHFTTQSTVEVPAPGPTTHYLKRVGNTMRWLALIFRANGSRATADANAPTNIIFKVGEDTLFNESYQYRRAMMYVRWGFDFPLGVLVYDAMHDFAAAAGFEVGDDYLHTQALVNASFIISYPAGFGSTNNSLTVLTDDLIYVAPVGLSGA